MVAVLFALASWKLAWSDYTIQDDARQHVFWMQQWRDRELFSDDLITDYFRSVAPAGYRLLYWLADMLGLQPFDFDRILPLLLGVGTSIYVYLVTCEIFPVPLAGFCASLLLTQNLWLLDDLVSGTPRAFFYPLFLGFIYYLLRRELLFCLLLIVLQGLFYPQVVLISVGVLCLKMATEKRQRYFYFVGAIVGIAILGFYKLQAREFSEVIDLNTARQLAEFAPAGRSAFFLDSPWLFWLSARRSGFFPFEWQYFALCSLGLFLPILAKFRDRFPLVKKLKLQASIIWQIIFASLGLFLLSHILLFRLHLPSRYSQHTWRIAIAILAGIAITILLDKFIKIVAIRKTPQTIITAIALTALLYPTYAAQSYPQRWGYVTGNAPELYQFLQQQPKDFIIATLSSQGDFIPSLAQRTVLTAREYSIPYHWDYYRQIRQRTQDLIQAQYSTSPQEVKSFIERYGADLWLLDRKAFTVQYLAQNDWLKQFDATARAISTLQQTQPAIVEHLTRCSIWQSSEYNLLSSKCLMQN